MLFYVGDMHLGHKNCIKHDNRPFVFIEDHDRALMELWNGRLGPNDDVIICGDFCYKAKLGYKYYAEQLSGNKILVAGNHDRHIINDPDFLKYFDSVHDMLTVDDGGHKIFCCHFPVAEWPAAHYGVKHFYAHVHRNCTPAHEFMKQQPNVYNIGVMHQSWRPWTAEEVIAGHMLF